MSPEDLNKLLKANDLGDDFLEDSNLLFDTSFKPLSREKFDKARAYANKKMAWYWTDTEKHYLLADCNRFHLMWLGHFQEWCTKHGLKNPAIGRAYGLWEGQPHMWCWAVIRGKLRHINWGEPVKNANYDGRGSVAV